MDINEMIKKLQMVDGNGEILLETELGFCSVTAFEVDDNNDVKLYMMDNN